MTISPSESKRASGFTLVELLVVIGIIALLMAFLVPALGPASGRALDMGTRQFIADLDTARQMAMTNRTRARVIVPTKNDVPRKDSDLAWRGYVIATLEGGASPPMWKLQSKWQRLPQGIAFDSDAPTDGVMNKRKAEKTPIDQDGKVEADGNRKAEIDLEGPYIEFRANGAASLDPTEQVNVILADAIVDNGNVVPKNKALQSEVVIEPLTGIARVK